MSYLSWSTTKPTTWFVRPVRTQISLGIRPVWSESLLCALLVAKDPNFLHADSQNSDQTGWMPRLIWVFAGHTDHFVGFVVLQLILLFYVLVMISDIRQVTFISALDVLDKWGDTGPLQPKHLREAVRRLRQRNLMTNTKTKKVLLSWCLGFFMENLPWLLKRDLSPVKRICVFERSVMTNFNCACPAIQRGQGSGFLSEGSSWLTACMSEQQRFWRDCTDAQARLNLRCSHRQ